MRKDVPILCLLRVGTRLGARPDRSRARTFCLAGGTICFATSMAGGKTRQSAHTGQNSVAVSPVRSAMAPADQSPPQVIRIRRTGGKSCVAANSKSRGGNLSDRGKIKRQSHYFYRLPDTDHGSTNPDFGHPIIKPSRI